MGVTIMSLLLAFSGHLYLLHSWPPSLGKCRSTGPTTRRKIKLYFIYFLIIFLGGTRL
jgi:hypothetical protein